ncbi:hypothetical protein H8356DRAFT_990670 [Neocallimastix lanati (nom. inval.)]|jgi:hypothetical protein|uniref:HSF-type DNA-binding domain-containing protein n=1 Tax=Neocallimastix californiae TaxID=1754190 RepID=A0A1Y2B8R9_9FUNG|nr:hypothetical protein H8356DRAFT_990670 [Neocallimastix sp. JGI-2020a]ORY30887.1 hypothetical protein LY90DRAFT_705398 [Neocallimastix californiae]|eukprot:ORY30887.1 hypothetical protein LY90DRAFT_705398 [Neocallimastix californiae]
MSSVYQLPSPPTQVSQLPNNGMAKPANSQISTPKEKMVSNIKTTTSTVTTNGQPVQVNSKTAVSGGASQKVVTKRKSGYLYNPLKIDTSVVSKSTPVSPTSQSSSPQPLSASSTQSPRPKSSSNNTFVHKLYQMLSDPKQSNFIKWNDTGLSFTIRNVQGFSHNVLPLHFRHNNFSSFVRQLNMYGFHKVNKSTPSTKGSDNQVWEFFHPKFIRDKPHLIEEIKRKQIENENWRSNAILQDQGRMNFARHNSFYGKNGTLATKRSSSTLVTTSSTLSNAVTVPPTIPSQNSQIVSAPEVTGPSQPVFIQSSEGIPANTMATVSVTSSGETVLIDPGMSMVQSVPVGAPGPYGVIQVPSQNISYSGNDVTAATSATSTPIPQAITMGNMMQQNPHAMVDPNHVVMNGPNVHPEVPQPVASQPAPLEGDVYYNIHLLQMQNQDISQRLNDLQMNVNNLMNTYSRRMDMQQSIIQQLMNSAQQQQMGNVTTVCSVDQGQAVVANNNNPVMTQGGMVTPSPIAHHQMMVQQNGYPQQQQQQQPTASPEQKIINQNQSMNGTPLINQENIDSYPINGVGYPAQAIYY